MIGFLASACRIAAKEPLHLFVFEICDPFALLVCITLLQMLKYSSIHWVKKICITNTVYACIKCFSE